MGVTSAGETLALQGLLAASRYLGLHTADPTDNGSVGEIAGGGYARQLVAFSYSGSNPTIASNNAILTYPVATLDWGTITHISVWTALAGGTCVATDAVDVAKTILNGDVARWPIGTLHVEGN